MFLTLYYIMATYLQAWRIKSICTKITQKLAEKTSVVFYNVPAEINDITTTTATSDLCTNRSQARISDVMWLRGNQRGCSLVPIQKLQLSPWVSFPDPPSLLPFDVQPAAEKLEIDQDCIVHLLLETDIVPNQECDENEAVLVEDFGRPIAWKVDSHFAILLESDVNHFTKLIMTTFMQDNLTVNDRLPLVRVESVSFEGQPQPFSLLKNYLRKQQTCRAMRHLNMNEWEKHLAGLRSLSILAHQATEYEFNKNRTEGKTGIVKPDLIPSKNVDETDSKSSPARNLTPNQSPAKIEAKISPLRNFDESNEDSLEIKSSSLNHSKTSTPNASPIRNIPNKSTPNKSSIDEKTKLAEVVKVLPNESKSSEPVSVNRDHVKRPALVRKKGSLSDCKPPNVLVYSETNSARDSVMNTLKDILEIDVYTVYPLTRQQAKQQIWIDNTCLLIICGTVDKSVGNILLNYFLKGGKVLSLCSDMLNMILPNYRTAEVREHELVQFSYDKWQKVKMMHHIFCYQPSPVKKHFSNESDDSSSIPQQPALVCPRSVEVQDLEGEVHSLDVKVLGTEETWNTPSLLLATCLKSCGKFVFSQVHLESDPSQFEADEMKFSILKQSNKARIEIFTDLLKNQLKISVQKDSSGIDFEKLYKSGYFLGRHELKFELLERLKANMSTDNSISTPNLNLKFCHKNETPPKASSSLLPILIHSCPEDFSTVDYYDNLKSNSIGRLVIYAPILTSSMHIVNGLTLTDGIAVIPRRQTSGQGRTQNQWLSPEGCIMFSLQLHIPLDSIIGQRVPLLQHLMATAIVHSICSKPGYENLDIGLKWPNDIYANGVSKIGGIMVNVQMISDKAICNAGCAINLTNSTPTTCLNDQINEYNRSTNTKLAPFTYEKLLAMIFTEMERLMTKVQNEGISHLLDLYYNYWLHSNQEIKIMDTSGEQKAGKIIGIDDYGYLKVELAKGSIESVHPDGNSFDMLRGLILPK